MQAQRYDIHQASTTPNEIFDARFMNAVGKMRRKKNNMLALTEARRVT
jgi:hypothetical protein